MSEGASSYVRPTLSALLPILTVLGLLNVYSDNTDVVRLGESTVCEGCSPRLVGTQRTPVSQTLQFQTAGTTLEVVECKRAFIFVGGYSCVKQP